jgi:DNA polymerase-1
MIKFVGGTPLIESQFATATVEEVLEYFKDKISIGLDLETKGRNPLTKPILSMQLGDADTQFVIDVRYVNILLFKELIESKIIIGHNLKFDYQFLKKAGIIINELWDTMLAECCLYRGYEKYGYGLDALVMRYEGIYLSKETRGEFFKIAEGAPFTESQIIYGAKDVAYLHNIGYKQLERANKYGLLTYIQAECEYMKPIADIEYRGMLVDQRGWLENAAKEETILIQLEKELDNELIALNPKYKKPCTRIKVKGKVKLINYKPDLFNLNPEPDRLTNINWASDDQVLKVVQELYPNIDLVDKKRGSYSTGDNVLGKIKNPPLLIKNLLNHREKAKIISTYGESFIKNYIREDGSVRQNFWCIKSTGRLSSGDSDKRNKKTPNWSPAANTQNIPAESHRKFFIARPGYKFLTLDYSQQEPKITAHYTQDPVLMDFINNGDGDTHSLISTVISSYFFNEEIQVSKENNPYVDRMKMKIRDIGKMINLGLDYGKTAFSVKDDLGCSQEEAQILIDKIKARFSKKEEYFNKKFWETMRNGYILVDPILKSKTFIEDIQRIRELTSNYEHLSSEDKKWLGKRKGAIRRASQNFPIQGTAACMTKEACMLIRNYFLENNIDAYIVNVVHDEIDIEAREDIAESVASKAAELMIQAGNKFCSTVPMKVDPVIADYWSK